MRSTVDWPRLLGDLQWLLGDESRSSPAERIPAPTAALAKFLDLPRSTVIGYIDGSEPKHATGVRIIAKWCALSGKGQEFVPISTPTLSAARARTVIVR